MRADLRVDGISFANATVGGDDATEGVVNIYEQLKREDINALILSGAVISWFNIIDLQRVFDHIQKPVVCLTYEESPGLEKYICQYFLEPGQKLERYQRLGPREMIRLKTGYDVFIRVMGTTADEARRYQRLGPREMIRLKTGYDVFIRVMGTTADEARVLLNKFTLDGRIPEPIKVARLAARATMHSNLNR